MLAKCSDVPVLFIAARTLEEDVFYGFELGGAGSQIKTVISKGYKITD